MPLFARRRLQAMIDDLRPALAGGKGKDLLARLEKKHIDQALPAEMELAIVWALQRLGPVEVEPGWFSTRGRKPDAFSEVLFPGYETIVEVAAPSDAALPGDKGMRNAHRKLCHLAGAIRKGAGQRISTYFFEESFYAGGQYIRRIKVPESLSVDATIDGPVRAWLRPDPPSPGDKLRLTVGGLDVILEWHDRPQHQFAYHSSMPPEVHDLVDNYLWDKMTEKAGQLKSEAFGGLRCLVLCDVGSTLLRRLEDRDHTNRRVCGAQIIQHFLGRPDCGLDVVLVFSPNRQTSFTTMRSTLDWKVNGFVRAGLAPVDPSGVQALVPHLPKPRFEGYQARQLHEQGLYAPTARPWSLSTTITSGRHRMTIKVSARVLLEVLAGVTPPGRLVDLSGDGGGILLHQLKLGRTLQALRLEPGGLDEDDDLAVLEFAEDDPAARPLRLPQEPDA